MSDAPALVLEHESDAPAALLAEWAADRGVPVELIAAGRPIPDPAGRPFLVSLGSEASAFDDAVPWLAAERAALDRAVHHDVPVLGICFGAQHLARALGGRVMRAPRPEVGWLDIETSVPGVVPPGPWLQWHRDVFTVPPGAELLARSPAGPQAFRTGGHLGVQFHPEVTPDILGEWFDDYRSDPDAVRLGFDPDAMRAEVPRRIGAWNAIGRALFDAWLVAAVTCPA
jgi:GMP synthase-like glutamine amidotransferase